ncbi:MAG: hypothetical protein AAF152_17660 [Cyanobacteria bacterium P01_A01_bin.114]
MAFSDYKNVAQVQAEYQIKYQEQNFVIPETYTPSQTFLEEFEFNQRHLDVFSSEAARCEIVIFPIVREVYKHYYNQVSFWVQKPLVYSDKLSGTPDYMISKKSDLGKTMLERPLLVVVEAKKNDFEQGWGQCLAELVAIEQFNDEFQQPIYGIVTDGKLWEFGQLMAQTFTKNIDSFTVTELSGLMGALKFVFDRAIAALSVNLTSC